MTDKCVTWEMAAERWINRLGAATIDVDGILMTLENQSAILLELARDWDQADYGWPERSNLDGAVHRALANMARQATRLDNSDLLVRSALHTLPAKQHDYGHGNITVAGMTGVAVRISDKVQRLRNLHARGTHPVNESWKDSVLDLFGYTVIGSMLIEGTFTLPLAVDVPDMVA